MTPHPFSWGRIGVQTPANEEEPKEQRGEKMECTGPQNINVSSWTTKSQTNSLGHFLKYEKEYIRIYICIVPSLPHFFP